MSTASKGRAREHNARAWLEDMGYTVVRSAGSKGCWDLVGICRTGIALVQCKTGRWPGTDELRELADFVAPGNARKLTVRFNYRKPLTVRELIGTQWVDIE